MTERREKILAFVMAGGEGTRLHPLTAQCCKPAVPFTGHHRVVDFVLSNFANSGIESVNLLVQYQAHTLTDHVQQAWAHGSGVPPEFITVLSPQEIGGKKNFDGTADAVAQSRHLIESEQPDLVAVFGADHIYRMDLRQMVEAHVAKGADATVATVPVPLASASSFGITEVDAGHWIRRFDEKPAEASAMPGRPGHALASMGNYLFSAKVLLRELQRLHASGDTDFGKHMLPRLAEGGRVLAYDFATNRVPGVGEFEEHAYWRDVGTLDAYFDAQMDTLGARPRFRLANAQWPIHTGLQSGEATQVDNGVLVRSIVGSGSVIHNARLNDVVLRPRVTVNDDAKLDRCVVMENCVIGRGARIRRAIIDQDNLVPDGEAIGYHVERDRRRFPVTDSGIVVVPRGFFNGTE